MGQHEKDRGIKCVGGFSDTVGIKLMEVNAK